MAVLPAPNRGSLQISQLQLPGPDATSKEIHLALTQIVQHLKAVNDRRSEHIEQKYFEDASNYLTGVPIFRATKNYDIKGVSFTSDAALAVGMVSLTFYRIDSSGAISSSHDLARLWGNLTSSTPYVAHKENQFIMQPPPLKETVRKISQGQSVGISSGRIGGFGGPLRGLLKIHLQEI
jgi:hypothetical protein